MIDNKKKVEAENLNLGVSFNSDSNVADSSNGNTSSFDGSYDRFIKQKDRAFSAFIRFVPADIRDKLINPQDTTEVKNMFENKGKFISIMMLSSALFSFYFDRFLRFKSVIYGITYRWTLFGFVFKYFLFPHFVVSNTIYLYYDPVYKSKMDGILGKYDLSTDEFKDVYDQYIRKKLVA
jgi:hypothetical protein